MTAFVVFWMMIAIIILFAVSLVCKLIHACVDAIKNYAQYVGAGIVVAIAVMLVLYLLAFLVNRIAAGELFSSLWDVIVGIFVTAVTLAIAGVILYFMYAYGGFIFVYLALYAAAALYYATKYTLEGSEWLYGKCDAGCMRLIGGVVARLTPDNE